jgi:hypothetical protein
MRPIANPRTRRKSVDNQAATSPKAIVIVQRQRASMGHIRDILRWEGTAFRSEPAETQSLPIRDPRPRRSDPRMVARRPCVRRMSKSRRSKRVEPFRGARPIGIRLAVDRLQGVAARKLTPHRTRSGGGINGQEFRDRQRPNSRSTIGLVHSTPHSQSCHKAQHDFAFGRDRRAGFPREGD